MIAISSYSNRIHDFQVIVCKFFLEMREKSPVFVDIYVIDVGEFKFNISFELQ